MKEKKLTEGPILPRLILFSLPMIAGNMLQQVYSLVDTFVVGRFIGSSALAAVGSSYALMVFINSIVIGLCMGSGALLSEDYGGEDRESYRKNHTLSFLFIGVVSLVITILAFAFTEPILSVLNTPSSLMAMTEEYVTVMFLGIIFIFLYNHYAYALRALGNSMVPLFFLGVSSVLNIALDIWFVLGLGMGIKGAAWATVISEAVSAIGLCIYATLSFPLVRLGWSNRPRGKDLLSLAASDISTGIQQSVMNFGILMIQGLVNSFGAVTMAAFASAVKIDTLSYMPSQEFGNAYSLFVSQNHGAGKRERIEKGTRAAMATSSVFCLILSSLIFVLAPQLMSIFVDSGEVEIIREGVRYLRIEGAFYIGIGILFLWYGYFRGIGKPRVSLYLTVVSLGTRVLFSYTFAPNTALGTTAIWLSIPIGWILADIVGLILFRREKKK